MQTYVDQAMASTINLPAFGTAGNNSPDDLARIVFKYLPKLKGLTFYPDKARSGQPLSPISLEEALSQEGVVFEEEGDKNTCVPGICGL